MGEGSAPVIFNLTPLTRQANDQRRFVVKGFDIPRRGLLIFLAAFLPALFAAMFAAILFGVYAIAVFAAVEGLAFWLIEGHSRQGMQLRNWQSIRDRKNARDGQVFVCGHPVDVLDAEIKYVRQRTAPVDKPKHDVYDIFDLEPIKENHGKKKQPEVPEW